MTFEELVDEYRTADEEAKAARTRADEAQAAVAAFLREASQKTLVASLKDGDYKVTVVERETIKFDEKKMLHDLGKRRFAKIAELKLSRGLLEQAVTTGEISHEYLATVSLVSKSAPYIRVTETGDDDA